MPSSHRLAAVHQASEKSIQHWCAELFRAAGCVVYSLAQPRATKQAIGLADLYVLVPRKRTAFWFEVKSAHGHQRPSQAAFQAACEASGVLYRMGGLDEARAVLAELGLTRFVAAALLPEGMRGMTAEESREFQALKPPITPLRTPARPPCASDMLGNLSRTGEEEP